ncbi:hypothetical protein RQP46_009781 [Phenoliferia psychrophenolica]
MAPIHLAFYVSGHGFGHATRASALTTALLAHGHQVTIITNAPETPFSAVLPHARCTYRRADVDAGIVQPKAYDVARQATVEVLEAFMDKREASLEHEEAWLRANKVQCVLSDATFLGCAAAARAEIPAILVSNFTFDSCYSYLSLAAPPVDSRTAEQPEAPIAESILAPLVAQATADYAHASLLLRYPGAIPIPAFDTDAPLPSGLWVNPTRTAFTDSIETILSRPSSTVPCGSNRRVVDVPLLVRPPSPGVYAESFRHALLKTMHVPPEAFDSKILLVSFGGQSIPRPRSQPPSPLASPIARQGGWNGEDISDRLDPANVRGREAGLLPRGWIAIVCGLSGDNNEIRNNLPEGFYASEKDVYVPDLTATADVVLGKLGYGTCSEVLSCRTPFIYVPRPLFVEEFGLKRLMLARGTAIELDRADFEGGRWELHVLEAHERGRAAKAAARASGFEDEGAGEVLVSEIEKFMLERA